jgi:hypothetical protein
LTAGDLGVRGIGSGYQSLVSQAFMRRLQTAVPITVQSDSGAAASPGVANGGGAPPIPGIVGNLQSSSLLVTGAKLAPAVAAVYFLAKGQHAYAAIAGAVALGAVLFL